MQTYYKTTLEDTLYDEDTAVLTYKINPAFLPRSAPYRASTIFITGKRKTVKTTAALYYINKPLKMQRIRRPVPSTATNLSSISQ